MFENRRLSKLETIEGPETNRLRAWCDLNKWWLDPDEMQPTEVIHPSTAATLTFSV